MTPHQTADLARYAIPAAIVALVLLLRWRSIGRARRLRLGTLWIVPAVFAVAFAAATFERPPPTALGWLWLALALAVGAAVGWRRGKLMRITVDPETHALNQQSSPAAFILLLILLLVRRALAYEGAALGFNVVQVTGILMAFALGLLTASRAEMYLRARRLLEAARAGAMA